MSDYSALFSNTSDMMFDATKFGVAIMTEDGFATLDDTHIHYSYAWKYNNPPKNDTEAKTMGEDFLKKLAKRGTIVNYIPNSSIRQSYLRVTIWEETVRCLLFFCIS